MQQDGISCQPIVSCTLACTNGRCFIDPNTKRPTCSCNIGYVLDKSKQNCLDLNECEEQPKPCEQECSNTIGSYKCSCSPGFTQDLVVANRCIDVDECQSNPCTNSGTCQNMVNKFSCHCTSGWTGVYCDEDVNECASRPCSHGGTCVNTPGSFSCRCAPGWSGTLCTLLVDECASNPCIHGTCVDQVNAFFCRCDEGWSGDTCTTNIDDCVNAQCQNGATCIDILKGYNCSCVLGYKGQYCQYNIDDCIGNECQHNSACLDGVNSYLCLCPSGWTGLRCATDIDECNVGPFPCHGTLGLCTNTPGSYACSCKPGYEGDGIQCFEKRLFDYGRNVYDQSPYIWDTDYVSPFFSPPYGFPFGTRFYQQLYFTDNGLIVFKENEDQSKFAYPNPTRNSWWYYTPMIAVFWDDCDFSSGIGKIYYQEYDFTVGTPSLNAIQLRDKVQAQVRANFSSTSDITNYYVPTWMLKITWEEAPAVPASNNGRYTNTFQAILSTDGIFSFCLQIFKDGGMRWRTEVRDVNNVVMGFMSGYGNSLYIDPISVSPNVTVRYRPDQAVGTNTGLKGRSTLRLDRNSMYTKNPKRECLNWYQSEGYAPYFSPFTTCPCFYWQGYFDMSYVDGNIIQMYGYNPPYVSGASRSLQSLWPDYNRGGVRCHYSWSGSLLSGGYERYLPTPWYYWSWSWWGGAYNMQQQRQEYQQKEADPYRYCCQSGDSRLCRLYQEKRPRNQCSFYRPPFFAFLLGDPHITTLDNVSYTFNGLGEYTVLEVSADQNHFTMQARTAIAGSNGTSKATSFVAIVAQENGSSKVEWILKDNITIVLLDSQVTQVSENKTFFNQTSVELSYGSVIASFPSGISVNVTTSYGALNFITLLPQKFVNQTQGLLGVFNGDPKDDFKSKNGTVLPFDGTNVPPENQLYYDFGVTWQIAANTSLFSYNTSAGESWHTYNNNSFVPMFYEELLNRTSAEKLANVSASCGGQKDCIFDVLSTDDPNFGMATKNSAGEFGSQGQTLQNFPPNITSSGQLSTKVNFMVWTRVIAEDPNNDTIVFTLTTNSSGLTITSDGNLTWSPRSSEPAFGVVSASDGKASSALLLNLTLCNCSANSMCLSNQTTLSINGSDGSTFQVSGCLCDPGYAGAYCTDDYNACVDSPCHPGVNCTDDPAPSLGFSCGPCPVGLTGNGSKCFDVDECVLQLSTCNQTCTNIFNGYTCSCNEGYRNVTMNSDRCEGILRLCFFFVADINECISGQNTCSVDANCTNTIGSYTCACKLGYEGNGRDCMDIDECMRGTNSCNSSISDCMNNNGSYYCTCARGFTGNGTYCAETGEMCTDVDECLKFGSAACGPGAYCVNTVGSYNCPCLAGYVSNGTHCLDVDECLLPNNNCSANSTCENTPGSFRCNCYAGFQSKLKRPDFLCNATVCEDIDECGRVPAVCGLGTVCENTVGSYRCPCAPGYQRDTSDGNATCSLATTYSTMPWTANSTQSPQTASPPRSTTSNTTITPASTISSISPVTSPTTSSTSTTVSNSGTTPTSNGTTTQSTKNVITSSISLTPSSATTVSTTSVPTTTAIMVPGLVKNLTLTSQGVKNTSLEVVWLAAEGYVEQYIAFISPQEASAVSVSPTGSLTARFSGLRPGVEYTITVKTFGRGNVSNAGVSVKQVTALNSCNLACTNGQCFIDAKTSMSTCYCNSGFSLTSPQICSDVDECQSRPCKHGGSCANTQGSYSCTCVSGWSGLNCTENIDECAGSVCQNNGTCLDGDNSYTCICWSGWRGVNCSEDVNECLSNPCQNNGTCLNRNNKFLCQCSSGFTGTFCEIAPRPPVPHHSISSTPCDSNYGTCNDTIGSFTCGCVSGYTIGSDGRTCKDVNECEIGIDNCTQHSTCYNFEGNYTCTCNNGYASNDGRTCQDINECQNGNANCKTNSSCQNIQGSFKCACDIGFQSNGISCEDEDECSMGKHNCTVQQTCINTVGSYNCQCNQGYQQTGSTCVDINECDTTKCPPLAKCTNTPGSYTCLCPSNYYNNGKQCVATSCAQTTCTTEYCSNGGTCFNNLNCTATCACLPGHTGDKCQYGLDIVSSYIDTDLHVTYSLFIYASFGTETNKTIIRDNSSSAVIAKLMVSKIYYDFKVNAMSTAQPFILNCTARFNYTTNQDVISIYDGTLNSTINNINYATRAALQNLTLLNSTMSNPLSKDDLLNYTVCSTNMPGYKAVWNGTYNIVCRSPCVNSNLCNNGGTCLPSNTGPVCICQQEGLYHSDGPTCENITIKTSAFFAILFASLGTLTLLGIGTYICWRYKTGRSYNIFGNNKSSRIRDEGLYQYIPHNLPASSTSKAA
ncbi:unnamed protein product [Lampetra fluviatilis]